MISTNYSWILKDEYEKFGIKFHLIEMKSDNVIYQKYQAYLPCESPCWPCCGKTEKEAVEQLENYIKSKYERILKDKEAFDKFMENIEK